MLCFKESFTWISASGGIYDCLDELGFHMHGSRSCLGCCTNSSFITIADESSKGLKTQGQTAHKPSMLEDFFSSSTYDMDSSAFQSHRSIPSISASNLIFDPLSAAGSINSPEFINHGVVMWNQTRQQWLGNKRCGNRKEKPRLSWNATYDLLGSNRRFPEPIPLPEVVDFLVDMWEQEGLYDI